MNILIYSFNRCGSSNLQNFLEQEFLNLNNKNPIVNTFFEPFSSPDRARRFKHWYSLNLQNKHTQSSLYVPNLIVKTIAGDINNILKIPTEYELYINNELLWYDSNYNWDKIIILYRESVVERVESMWAQRLLVKKDMWDGNESYYLDNDIPQEEFEKRIKQETNLQNQINSYNDDADDILKISYESLYYRDGLETLKKFLNRKEWYNIERMSPENKNRKFEIKDASIIIDKNFIEETDEL